MTAAKIRGQSKEVAFHPLCARLSGDVSAYIPTNVIPGQRCSEIELFEIFSGIPPYV